MLPADKIMPPANWPFAELLNVMFAAPPFCPQVEMLPEAMAEELVPSTVNVPAVPLEATLIEPPVESAPPAPTFTCEPLTTGKLFVPVNCQLEPVPETL